MRVYIAATPKQIQALLTSSISIDDYLSPEQFEFDNAIDMEEREHLISLLAAEDALSLNGGKFGLVIAADLTEAQLATESIDLEFNQVAALLYSDDAETLSWYAPEEIQYQIGNWLS